MTDLLIRPARLTDIGVILALLANDTLGQTREVVGETVDAGYIDAFNAIARDENQHLMVAEADGRVVGTFQLSYLPGLSHQGAWRAQIEAVRVATDLRGQGLGRQMMIWAIEAAQARGCRMVQLTSHKTRHDAHRFYESLGFARSHAGFKRVL
ncbi:GNAT superfamily N-acetyltransferase [Sagittula marina]|uniref:GNAT superfamily N-acetyltransferase n=1 Tax=Sagittula marina TaxID=943940 RepID=A0A7W6DP09_9RHOB|nr:GNAT family N-acetyltransferase [Sagittula marina]MBB3984090.1 GNAT superfamily N-acetyltransferase [Sagittula marina]